MEDYFERRLPVDHQHIEFQDWYISYEKSHILKSICVKGQNQHCVQDTGKCELCMYRSTLNLPSLPDMVFHKNKLSLRHRDGALLEFLPIDALRFIENVKIPVQVACSAEWKQSRPEALLEEKFQPFDWTFTSFYEGTINDKFRIEETSTSINRLKLMQRENILFYHDLTLFEDELHDHGISICSVKIRVMASGFFVLLRHFLRVDNVVLKMHDTRFYFEVGKKYILKEFTQRIASYKELKDHYRINKPVFKYLLKLLAEALPEGKKTFYVPPIIKLVACLRFLAEGGYQKGVGWDKDEGIAQSTFSTVLSQVLEVFERKLCAKWIVWPSQREEREIAQSFYVDGGRRWHPRCFNSAKCQ